MDRKIGALSPKTYLVELENNADKDGITIWILT